MQALPVATEGLAFKGQSAPTVQWDLSDQQDQKDSLELKVKRGLAVKVETRVRQA